MASDKNKPTETNSNATASDKSNIEQAQGNISKADNAGMSVGGDVGGDVKQTNVNQSVGGDNSGQMAGVIYNQNFYGTPEENKRQETLKKIDTTAAQQAYLHNLISKHEMLRLDGIKFKGQAVDIKLEEIYITLKITKSDTANLEQTRRLHELSQHLEHPHGEPSERVEETLGISVNEALQKYDKLVVKGKPGSGKTTFLRYLAVTYANAHLEEWPLVRERLSLDEDDYLPIFVTMRNLANYLQQEHAQAVQDGPLMFIDYLHHRAKVDLLELPEQFFIEHLKSGRVALFLDGLDEIADDELRRRVSQLVDRLTEVYDKCRYVVSSRPAGYERAKLTKTYTEAEIKDFNRADRHKFLITWYLLERTKAVGIASEIDRVYAEKEAARLMTEIEANDNIRELAVNPLLLTVIVIVHSRYTALPDRRVELYELVMEVMLESWDERGKKLKDASFVPDAPFDKVTILQETALFMQTEGVRTIDKADFRKWLNVYFSGQFKSANAEQKTEQFLRLVEERLGLLTLPDEGSYGFAHLTFQEYLAARAIAKREDCQAYILERMGDTIWREVVLLTAAVLSLEAKRQMTALVRAIANQQEEPERFYNLVLAAECLQEVGQDEANKQLQSEIFEQLLTAFRKPKTSWRYRLLNTIGIGGAEERDKRRSAANALGRLMLGQQDFWTKPYGEPKWIRIPTGIFTMGEKDEAHPVELDTFHIAQVPVTNAQYALFVEDTNHVAPSHWEDGKIPKGLEAHPVVYVSWNDALDYCEWLSEKTDKKISLPSEAQWEKAARGMNDQRIYPWGDEFDPLLCNSHELGLGMTTPVGIFPEGASPFGVLDMSGNVWEWCSSIYKRCPYKPDDGRENMERDNGARRVLRGGSFDVDTHFVRAASRLSSGPDYRYYSGGFRLCVVRPPSQ